MITEDYVSFEVAKLLKEKGFDVYGDGSYDSGIEIYKEYSPVGKLNSCATSKPSKKAYPAPTLQMAMKWLREVHKLYVSVIPAVLNWEHQDIQDGWACEVTHLSDLSYDGDYEFFQKKYQTYESACEAAIRYCLENLI